MVHLLENVVGSCRRFCCRLSRLLVAFQLVECARRMGQPRQETEAEIYARVDQMITDGLKSGTIKVEELADGSVLISA